MALLKCQNSQLFIESKSSSFKYCRYGYQHKTIQLAQRYLEEMKFDLPLAVVWAYLFINGKMDEAENLYKVHPVSLSKVNHLICREINSNKNFELARTYVQFLKSVEAEQHVKINAYRTLFDVLFCKDMYQDAIALILECLEYKIPLSKLRHSTLTVLHDFCERERKRKGGLPYFHLPAKDLDSSYDSDMD